MSVRMICTASGVQPSARQVPSVSSFASLRRCSVVRPSNIWTLIIGMALSLSILLAILVIDRDVTGLRRDAGQPGADVRIGIEVETALGGDVRVAIERDVGETVAPADEVLVTAEMLLHDAQCCVALLHPSRQ